MKKNGFTLIELLAVIIILGILMIIAIPSVTKYISDSRKSTYIDTAKEIISGARNMVNDGKLEMFDTDATYYIDVNCIKTENGVAKSPYGDFTKAYVVVIYDGKGYDYFWTSVDDAGQGIKGIVKYDLLDSDYIESDLDESDILNTAGVDGRSKYMIIDESTNCEKGTANNVTKKINGATGEEEKPLCKRAKVEELHTVQCRQSSSSAGCRASGPRNYEDPIIYGNQTTTAKVLNPGDAFDCDVDANGEYDPQTERFYYLTTNNGIASLIYYSSVVGGEPSNQNDSFYYDTSAVNNNGPVSAYDQLPNNTTQWDNELLVLPVNRQIVNENGLPSTSAGAIELFTYTGRAARFLTYQEVQDACGDDIESIGDLNNCEFLFENTKFQTNVNNERPHGYWLETPKSNKTTVAYWISTPNRDLYAGTAFPVNSAMKSVRPVIDVNIADIDY